MHVEPNVRLIHIDDGDTRQLELGDIMLRLPSFIKEVHQFTQTTGVRYHILHCHYYHGGEVGLRLRAKGDHWKCLPIVLMYHSIGSLECPDEGRRVVERRIAGLVDCIIAATVQDRDDIVKHCECPPEKIRIIPCGVDLTLFHPSDQTEARAALGLPLQPFRIGIFVGRVDPVKNIKGIISALAILKERYPQYVILRTIRSNICEAYQILENFDCWWEPRK